MRPGMLMGTLIGVLAVAVSSTGAWAQEAMHTAAATMPSPGVFVVRPMIGFSQYGRDEANGVAKTEQVEALASVQYGFARAWSATLDIPAAWRDQRLLDGSADSDQGVSDLDVTFKHRFYKDDTTGVNTVRAVALIGGRFASGDDHDFSGMSFNPHIGAAVTLVQGRHGFNQEVEWTFNTGGSDDDNIGGGHGASDAFRYNSAYLYRIVPAEYSSETTGSWYLTAELNGLYETNGDHELRIGPGVMYEGRDVALELMVQLPLAEDVNHRGELDYAVWLGLRVTF